MSATLESRRPPGDRTMTTRSGWQATFHVMLLFAFALAASSAAQETDVTQTPNAAGAGAKRSYVEQAGAGRGDWTTPDSSTFLIARDPFRSIRRGRNLFQR